MKHRRFLLYFVSFGVLLGGLTFGHLYTGFQYLAPSELLRILLGGGTADERLTVFDFRMVRVVAAALVGVGLSVAGYVFQQMTHNELAGPGLLGVNAGAGLAVLWVILVTAPDVGLSLWLLPAVAVLGAMVTATGIYTLSLQGHSSQRSYNLILSGIVLSAGLHAVQTILVVRLSPEKFQQANSWLIGSISATTWSQVGVLTAILGLAFGYVYSRRHTLNVLALHEEVAIGLGTAVKRQRLCFLVVAVIMAATSVALGGSIGFIGLMAPHAARRLVGADSTYALPLTALIGATVLVGADWVGRTIIAPNELLTGMVVTLVGAPYFLYMLWRKRGV